jgi:2-polyprenyl-3-methyl-5-hydroxy-6-metoxy-1,4-benzoquinol methylase
MDHTEATAVVSLLYQTILGREADAEGLRNKADSLVTGRQTLPQLLLAFKSSNEFADKQRRLRPNLTGFPAFADADVFVAPDVVEALFSKTATYWRSKASQPEEMYWSVLTEANWRRAPTTDDRRAFVQTGADYAKRVLADFTRRTGRPAAGLRCLDFGCGVGRLALNFAPQVAEVCAVDFSGSHLAELKKNAELFGCGEKVSTWLLEKPRDLENVPTFDVAYSLIALQHNTPPVIAFVIGSLLRHLHPNGIAFLHVTLARVGYQGFSVERYLADPEAGSTMEVHFLPRQNLNAVVQRAGCELVTSRCIGGNDQAYSEEFVIRRPGP